MAIAEKGRKKGKLEAKEGLDPLTDNYYGWIRKVVVENLRIRLSYLISERQ